MLRTWSDTRKSKEGEQMSEKMKDGKWYVPRDLGIIKATEEQGGTYYRVRGEDGKDKWIPAMVFNEMFLPAAKSEIPERFADETAERFFQRSFPKEEVDGFPKGDVEHFKSMLSDFARYTANRFLRALVISKMAEEAAEKVASQIREIFKNSKAE